MADRYWQASELIPDDHLLDWVSDNVADAIRYHWEEDPPTAWIEDFDIEDSNKEITMVVCGPGKPTQGDPCGMRDVYSISIDVLRELTSWATPYAGLGGPRGDEQREDVRQRAEALFKLSAEVAALAEIAQKAASDH